MFYVIVEVILDLCRFNLICCFSNEKLFEMMGVWKKCLLEIDLLKDFFFLNSVKIKLGLDLIVFILWIFSLFVNKEVFFNISFFKFNIFYVDVIIYSIFFEFGFLNRVEMIFYVNVIYNINGINLI